MRHCTRGFAGVLLLAGMLAGCSSIDGPGSALIPNKELVISRSLSIPVEGLVLGAIVYLVTDPLAPNWEIAQSHLGGHRYAFALKKKRFATGGDGEAAQVFRRRINELAREQGYSDYDVLEFTAGIESTLPVAQRVSHGIVQYR